MKYAARIILGLLVILMLIFAIEAARADTAAVCAVTKGEWVWVRSAPDKTADKVDSVRWGYDVEISEIVNGYARIKWASSPQKEGWADVSYFDMPITETVYQVTSDGPLNVRETPDGRFLRKLKAGARVSVLGWRYSKAGELWAKVYLGGYVNAKFLAEAN